MATAEEGKNETKEHVEVSEETIFGRELDFMEGLSFQFEGMSNVAHILVVESPVPITEDLVTKAAILLSRRHPLLRSKVTREVNPRNGKERVYYSEIEKEDERIDVRFVDEISWEETHVRDGKTSYDLCTGPLWRLWLLKSQEIDKKDSKTGHSYCTNMILGYHHGIMDGNAGIRLTDHLLTYLEMVHSAKDDDPLEVESLPFLPSLYDLLPPNAMKMSWWQKPKLVTFALKEMVKSSENVYMKHHPAEMVKNEDVAHESRILPVVIPEPLTTEFIKRCKENGITVHGALTAAFSIAMVQLTFGESVRSKKSIATLFQINMRRYLPSNPGDDNMGVFFGNMEMPVKVPVVKTPDDFWKLAKTCYQQVHRLLEREVMEMSKIFKYLIDDLGVNIFKLMLNAGQKSGHGRMRPLFSISNMGRCDFVTRENGRTFELIGTYMSVYAASLGPIFVNNIFTFRKCIYWSIVYYTQITSKETVQQYADLAMKILTNACE
ncbi:uncharacterized protein LOC144451937 [Glandiceps talaboti]